MKIALGQRLLVNQYFAFVTAVTPYSFSYTYQHNNNVQHVRFYYGRRWTPHRDGLSATYGDLKIRTVHEGRFV